MEQIHGQVAVWLVRQVVLEFFVAEPAERVLIVKRCANRFCSSDVGQVAINKALNFVGSQQKMSRDLQ